MRSIFFNVQDARKLLLFALFGAGLMVTAGCLEKVNTVFGTEVQTGVRAQNQKNIQKILARAAQSPSASVRIGLVTDSHLNYDEFDAVVDQLNTLDLDFVVHLGDYTDLGSSAEYDGFVTHLSRLRHPVIVVLGNHDAIGAGWGIYQKVFGDFNFSFSQFGRKFVFYNSNRLEFRQVGGYNPDWLREQLRTSEEPVYLFQHVPFNDPTYFSNEDFAETSEWLLESGRLKFMANGHNHAFSEAHKIGDLVMHYVGEVKGVRYATLEIQPDQDIYSWCVGAVCGPPSSGQR